MKPYEETWKAHGPAVTHDPDRGGMGVGQFWTSKGEGNEVTDARARLAAKAPEMARMLLAEEWTIDGERGEPYCDRCQSNPDRGHGADCPWLALMKAIGAR